MTTDRILAEIDAEISRLQKVRALLSNDAANKNSTAAPVRKRRKMSAAARKRIAAVQKARWAKQKAAK